MFQLLRLFRLAMRLVRINDRNRRRQAIHRLDEPKQRVRRVARRNRTHRNPWG